MPVDKTAQCDSCLDISSITICLNHELWQKRYVDNVSLVWYINKWLNQVK
jgi:hypothetical protein